MGCDWIAANCESFMRGNRTRGSSCSRAGELAVGSELELDPRLPSLLCPFANPGMIPAAEGTLPQGTVASVWVDSIAGVWLNATADVSLDLSSWCSLGKAEGGSQVLGWEGCRTEAPAKEGLTTEVRSFGAPSRLPEVLPKRLPQELFPAAQTAMASNTMLSSQACKAT